MRLRVHTASSPDEREPPTLTGFDELDDCWQLELSYYRDIIADVTGVELDEVPSDDEIKIIQSRIEGCLEAYERDGQCVCQKFGQYTHVDSFETVHDLARFFRAAVAARIEPGELTY